MSEEAIKQHSLPINHQSNLQEIVNLRVDVRTILKKQVSIRELELILILI